MIVCECMCLCVSVCVCVWEVGVGGEGICTCYHLCCALCFAGDLKSYGLRCSTVFILELHIKYRNLSLAFDNV